MRQGFINWNGQRSDMIGVEISEYPKYPIPQRKMETYKVPGRNGDIIMMQDAWDNVSIAYSIFIGDGVQKHSVPVAVAKVSDWLCTPTGYCVLWDDFDPDHFRLAYFEGPHDIESLSIGRVGRTEIRFNCKPQRYLFSGTVPVEISSSPATIYNPTMYPAKPMIFIDGTTDGTGTVTVNGPTYTITGIPASGLYIDCEEMNCFDGNGLNMNSHVANASNQFPKLSPGTNEISFSGDVSSVTITPRWFEI